MAENLVELNDDNFKTEISTGVTLVDFYADWCGPCRMMAPMVEEIAEEFRDRAKVAKLDIENSPQATTSFGVTSIPTLIIFKEGEEKERVVGVKDKESLVQMITSQF